VLITVWSLAINFIGYGPVRKSLIVKNTGSRWVLVSSSKLVTARIRLVREQMFE